MSGSDASADGSAIPSTAPCGFLEVDHQGTIIKANAKLGEWVGLPASELSGAPLVQLFSKASKVVFHTSIVPVLALKGQVDGATLDLVNTKGAKTPVLLSAAVSGSKGRSVTTFVFLLADARRAFERDLAKARAEAEMLLSSAEREAELREQFIAILGHDLRNPLASIASAMNILSRGKLSEKDKHIVTLTRGSVRRMSLMIDNILDFARSRLGGGMPLNLSEGKALQSEIEQVVAEQRSAHHDRIVLLELGNLDSVRCDVSRTGQLLSNLLGNAHAYGDPTRPIHVDARISSEGTFELEVTNFGSPIPSSASERLFDPFVRSDRLGNPKGLGLGLFIAAEIAKAHGGRLGVRSIGRYTTFTLHIPQR